MNWVLILEFFFRMHFMRIECSILKKSVSHCSYPIELIVQEMTGNAAFLRSILERCVDTNHNGQITLRELFSGVATPIANEMI